MDEMRSDQGRPPRDWQSFIDEMERNHKGECPYPCPFCMGATMIQQMNPEIASHLAAAGREFLLAARAFMESLQTRSASSHRESGEVENIPVD